MNVTEIKTCFKCEQTKPASEFYKNQRGNVCKACHRQTMKDIAAAKKAQELFEHQSRMLAQAEIGDMHRKLHKMWR